MLSDWVDLPRSLLVVSSVFGSRKNQEARRYYVGPIQPVQGSDLKDATTVMVVTTVNPKIFVGNLYLNSTPSTKFYFDPALQAISEFTARFKLIRCIRSRGLLFPFRTICSLQLIVTKAIYNPQLSNNCR
ncbi:unnamed protein product [Brassica rapa subsp. narinosa]